MPKSRNNRVYLNFIYSLESLESLEVWKQSKAGDCKERLLIIS